MSGEHDTLTDELLISAWIPQHQLCPISQRKDIQRVHELAEVQAKCPSHPGTAVLSEQLHARISVCSQLNKALS